jgi:hypothetical protein
LSRALVAALVAAAVVVAAVLAVATGVLGGGDEGGAAPTKPLAATATVDPPTALFGDRITARADVVVDGRRVDPDTVRLDADFAPFALAAPVRRTVTESGDATSIAYRYDLLCLTEACVPAKDSTRLQLPDAHVRARLHDGTASDVALAWPALDIARRVPAADFSTTRSPKWRARTDLPAATYRTDPIRLANALTLAAVLLAALGLGLGVWELERNRRRRLRRVEARSLLAHTLDLVRQSTARGADDRRKALALLARVLSREPVDGRLAGDAARLAWSRPEPSPAGVEALADEVEQEARP